MKSLDLSTVSARIRYARRKAGITQTDLANRVNIKQPSVAIIERGGHTDKTYAFAKALGVSMEWLENGVGDMLINTQKTFHLHTFHQLFIAALIAIRSMQKQIESLLE